MNSRNLTIAKVVALRTRDGKWSGGDVTLGAEYPADLNTIRQASVYTGQGHYFTGQFIDIERDGNGRFWPWPTELLEFKRPKDKRDERPTPKPGELI